MRNHSTVLLVIGFAACGSGCATSLRFHCEDQLAAYKQAVGKDLGLPRSLDCQAKLAAYANAYDDRFADAHAPSAPPKDDFGDDLGLKVLGPGCVYVATRISSGLIYKVDGAEGWLPVAEKNALIAVLQTEEFIEKDGERMRRFYPVMAGYTKMQVRMGAAAPFQTGGTCKILRKMICVSNQSGNPEIPTTYCETK